MKLKEKIMSKPVKVLAISTVVLFYMLTPLIAQKYYNISAIKVSFAITVVYFVVWKLYNKQEFLSKKI